MINQKDATTLRKYIKYLDAKLSEMTNYSKDESSNNLFSSAKDLDTSLEYAKIKPEEFYKYRFFDEQAVLHYNSREDNYTIRTYGIKIEEKQIPEKNLQGVRLEKKYNQRTQWTEIKPFTNIEDAQILLTKIIINAVQFRQKRIEYGL